MDDLINRQTAINIAKELIIPMEEYQQNNQAINNYCAELIKLPPAQKDGEVDRRISKYRTKSFIY